MTLAYRDLCFYPRKICFENVEFKLTTRCDFQRGVRPNRGQLETIISTLIQALVMGICVRFTF